MKPFMSSETAARECGLSLRHFRRMAAAAGVTPAIISRKAFFTPKMIEIIRSHHRRAA